MIHSECVTEITNKNNLNFSRILHDCSLYLCSRFCINDPISTFLSNTKSPIPCSGPSCIPAMLFSWLSSNFCGHNLHAVECYSTMTYQEQFIYICSVTVDMVFELVLRFKLNYISLAD